MFCTQCGAQLNNGAQQCPQCGALQGPATANATVNASYASGEPLVKTYLIHNIISTLFCCLPLGIIGIIYSVGADSAQNVGNYIVAQAKAKVAGRLFWIAVICSLIGYAVVGVMIAAGAVAEVAAQ